MYRKMLAKAFNAQSTNIAAGASDPLATQLTVTERSEAATLLASVFYPVCLSVSGEFPGYLRGNTHAAAFSYRIRSP